MCSERGRLWGASVMGGSCCCGGLLRRSRARRRQLAARRAFRPRLGALCRGAGPRRMGRGKLWRGCGAVAGVVSRRVRRFPERTKRTAGEQSGSPKTTPPRTGLRRGRWRSEVGIGGGADSRGGVAGVVAFDGQVIGGEGGLSAAGGQEEDWTARTLLLNDRDSSQHQGARVARRRVCMPGLWTQRGLCFFTAGGALWRLAVAYDTSRRPLALIACG